VQFPILSYADFYQTMPSAGKKRCRAPLSKVLDMTATGSENVSASGFKLQKGRIRAATMTDE